jgi:hypothetical protein
MTSDTITPRQQSFIESLVSERAAHDLAAAQLLAWIDEARQGKITRGAASELIDDLKAVKRISTESRSGNGVVTVTEPGVYRKGDDVFIVKPNKDKTRLYCKRLVESAPRLTERGEVVDFEAVYAPGAIYDLTPEHKMGLVEAEELTARYGRCIVCGRHLKAAESVARGIGPVCRGYFTVKPEEREPAALPPAEDEMTDDEAEAAAEMAAELAYERWLENGGEANRHGRIEDEAQRELAEHDASEFAAELRKGGLSTVEGDECEGAADDFSSLLG